MIDQYVNPITNIGNQVNDPSLFKNIQQSCFSRRAFLFVVPNGFYVLKPIVKEASGVLIWVAHSRKKVDLAAIHNEVEFLAKKVGAEFIELWSVRKGLFRVLPKLSYTFRNDTWCDTPITVWTKTL